MGGDSKEMSFGISVEPSYFTVGQLLTSKLSINHDTDKLLELSHSFLNCSLLKTSTH